jgi:hypothetical protein
MLFSSKKALLLNFLHYFFILFFKLFFKILFNIFFRKAKVSEVDVRVRQQGCQELADEPGRNHLKPSEAIRDRCYYDHSFRQFLAFYSKTNVIIKFLQKMPII